MRIVFFGAILAAGWAASIRWSGPLPAPQPAARNAQAVKKQPQFDTNGWGRRSKVVEAGEYAAQDFFDPAAVNGVSLRIKAKRIATQKPEAVVVEWRLWYTGPRPPLVVRRPSLKDFSREYSTQLSFIATTEAGKAYEFSYSNAVAFGPVPSLPTPPELFVRVAAASSARGIIRVNLDEVRAWFREQKPAEFKTGEEQLYVKLYFSPTDRGTNAGFDAWTGETNSSVALVFDWAFERVTKQQQGQP